MKKISVHEFPKIARSLGFPDGASIVKIDGFGASDCGEETPLVVSVAIWPGTDAAEAFRAAMLEDMEAIDAETPAIELTIDSPRSRIRRELGEKLRYHGIYKLGDLTKKTAREIESMRRACGEVEEIRAALASHGLKLKGDPD